MSNRIEQAFSQLAAKKQKALITFIMGGDPDLKTSETLLAKLPDAGADLIEIGIPFSDPMADGPTIQAAGLRALKAGTKLKNILNMVANFRKTNQETPLILMGYFNPIHHYGVKQFCADAVKAGADGVILVDLPPEEEEEFTSVAGELKLIRLVAPTTHDARFKTLSKNAGGFLYYIAVAGITGTKSADMGELAKRVGELKKQTKLPVAVGFGIKTPQQAKEIATFSDAVVVGSALVELAAKEGADAALSFVKKLKAAIA